MKHIFKPGKDMSKKAIYYAKCWKCGSEFSYAMTDTQPGQYNETIVECPNPTCKSYIDHDEQNIANNDNTNPPANS